MRKWEVGHDDIISILNWIESMKEMGKEWMGEKDVISVKSKCRRGEEESGNLVMSLIYRMKRSGPRIDPRDTPEDA